MTATLIGYAHCSTDKQDLAAQRAALEKLGVAPERNYMDRGLTGANRRGVGHLRAGRVAARHWPLARFSLESIRGNDGPRGDCQRHRKEHRYRSKVTNIPRSSDRSRQPQNKQRCQPGACAYDIENHLYARPRKEETRDRYGAQTDHVARDDNGEDVVDQYLSLAGGRPCRDVGHSKFALNSQNAATTRTKHTAAAGVLSYAFISMVPIVKLVLCQA